MDLLFDQRFASEITSQRASGICQAGFYLRDNPAKPNLHPYERKYLIAHALGHHLFHRKGLFRDYISLHEKGLFGNLELGRFEIVTKEREADIFAAYFLIHEEKLKPILEKKLVRGSPNPIPKLAEMFQVPEELMKKRLEFEGLVDISKLSNGKRSVLKNDPSVDDF